MYHSTLTDPNVNMSESERMPGYLKKSQVPPMLLLRSRMRKEAQGSRSGCLLLPSLKMMLSLSLLASIGTFGPTAGVHAKVK